MMRVAMLASSLSVAAAPAVAEIITCTMGDAGTPLSFEIDHTQFAGALNPNEPPRQQRTVVTFGDKQFPATPFLLGDVRGFEAEGLGGTTPLFVMRSDGEAVYSDARAGLNIIGNCTAKKDAQ